MPIAFGSSIVFTAAVSASQTISFSAGAVSSGQLMVVNFEWDGTGQATITRDPAWALITVRNTVPGQDMAAASFYKIADATDAAGTSSYSFTFSASVNHQALIDTYNGTDQSVPIAAGPTVNAAIPNPGTAMSVTVARTGSWVRVHFSAFNSGGSWPAPTGYMARAAGQHSACFDSNGAIAPGPSGNITSTYSVSPGEWVAQAMVIQPPAPPATTGQAGDAGQGRRPGRRRRQLLYARSLR